MCSWLVMFARIVCVLCRQKSVVVGIPGMSLTRQWFRGGPHYTLLATMVKFQRRKC
jgi:hypothetical protein